LSLVSDTESWAATTPVRYHLWTSAENFWACTNNGTLR
jgi:hypothetical protein